jgi:putative ABC transport system permease protein
MLTLVLRDLQYRRWRVLLVIALISVFVALLFLMNGLIGQFNREPALAVEQIGGDRSYAVASNSSGPLTTPQAVPREVLESIEGSTVFLMGRSTDEDRAVMLVGLPIGEFAAELVAGQLPERAGQVVVDESSGYAVGDVMMLSRSRNTVVGLMEDSTVFAGLPLAFVPLETAQQTLLNNVDIVSGALVNAGSEIPPTLRAMTPEEVAVDIREPLDSAIDSVSILRLLLWAVTGVLIGTMIFATATGRVRDIAVLKAIGGRDSLLAGSLILEAALIALIATAVAVGIQQLARPLFPLTIRIPAATWWQIPLIAVVIALIAASLGVRKVLNTSPAEAFG